MDSDLTFQLWEGLVHLNASPPSLGYFIYKDAGGHHIVRLARLVCAWLCEGRCPPTLPKLSTSLMEPPVCARLQPEMGDRTTILSCRAGILLQRTNKVALE